MIRRQPLIYGRCSAVHWAPYRRARRVSVVGVCRRQCIVLGAAREASKTIVVESGEVAKDEETKRRRSVSPKSKMKAVAEKVSAARELARRLAEEKEAAIKTGKLYSEKILKSTEAAATEAAVQAAEADSLNRAVLLAEAGAKKDAELSYLKKLNKALRKIVLEVAFDKTEAQQKLNELELSLKETELLIDEEEEVLTVLDEAVTEAMPPVVEEVTAEEVKVPELVSFAEECLRMRRSFFTTPSSPVVGKPVRFLYNRLGGPLPESDALSIKYGLNKWEEIGAEGMKRCEELKGVEGEWWDTEQALPALLYRYDFVVMDDISGLVDNNETKDYQLKLKGAPTKSQLLEKRLELFEETEKKRRHAFELEIENFTAKAERKAAVEMTAARERVVAEWEAELTERVTEVIGDRRAQTTSAPIVHDTIKGAQLGWFGERSPGSTSLLAYNSEIGPLQNASSIRVHLGTDHWYNKLINILELRPLTGDEISRHGIDAECGHGRWWGVEIQIPEEAVVMDYVFDDGQSVDWDNNNGRDYTTSIRDPLTYAQLIENKKELLREDLAYELQRRIDAAASAVKDRIMLRVCQLRLSCSSRSGAQLDSRIRRWESQWKYLYTDPLHVRAGEKVAICYRPDLTVLRGRPDSFVHVGFNHWRHRVAYHGVRLEPVIANGIGFHSAVIDVPEDATDMDLAFSDNPDLHSGFVDNNHGYDYHFPVTGSTQAAIPLNVIHVTVEMAPIAKVGGLADVVTALGRAVMEEGHNVHIIMPKYDCLDYSQVSGLSEMHSFNSGGSRVGVWSGQVEGLDVSFIEPDNGFFWVGCIYGLNNDAERFAYFCRAASDYIRIFNVAPDIVHCHDWQTAPVVWSDLAGARTVFTIHNLNYGADLIGRAMQSTTIATTVSPTYATEISGSPSIESNFDKLYGVLNGIDIDIWDPSRDRFLPMNYNSDNVVEGKNAVRSELRNRLNLAHIDVPIVGVVTRLTPQKGIHLIKHAAWRTLERGSQFILLGSAPDPRIQQEFDQLADDLKSQYPDRAALLFAYDEPMSHLIYAGCDIFLVPSIFEPCGLTQMIAMRYGTVPVVRKTGGLNDTVFDVDSDDARAQLKGLETNGYHFDGADEGGMDYALNRALGFFFNDRSSWNDLTRRIMLQDWSWSLPALDYLTLYYKALG